MATSKDSFSNVNPGHRNVCGKFWIQKKFGSVAASQFVASQFAQRWCGFWKYGERVYFYLLLLLNMLKILAQGCFVLTLEFFKKSLSILKEDIHGT